MSKSEQELRSHGIAAEEALRIDMQAFDRLPASYRDLIRTSPIEIPATVACAYLSAFGQRLGLQILKWAVNARLLKNRRNAGEARADGAGRLSAGTRRLTAEPGAGNKR